MRSKKAELMKNTLSPKTDVRKLEECLNNKIKVNVFLFFPFCFMQKHLFPSKSYLSHFASCGNIYS